MAGIDPHHLIDMLFAPRVVWTVLWAGLATLTLSLMILMRTRWGQVRPLSKCIALSVLAHALLLVYAYTTNLFLDCPAGVAARVVHVSIRAASDEPEKEKKPEKPPKPWQQPARRQPTVPKPGQPARRSLDATPAPKRGQVAELPSIAGGVPTETLPVEAAAPPPTDAPAPENPRLPVPGVKAAAIEVPKATRQEASAIGPPLPERGPLPRIGDSRPIDEPMQRVSAGDLPTELFDPARRLQRLADVVDLAPNAEAGPGRKDETSRAAGRGTAEMTIVGPWRSSQDQAAVSDASHSEDGRRASSPRRAAAGDPLPPVYGARFAEDRVGVARRHGGGAQTEAAVRAALRWLAEHQSPDGRWSARALEAGRETAVAGQQRGGAGADADTGITGLALLALMAAGHTHLEGAHRKNVQHALEFLLRSERRDGCLAGDARTFAVMYCHGMATLALAEAYAITGDKRLGPFVERAVAYTVAAQNPTTGGWRYRPGDRGDMSQFGWQLMALKSAELAGIKTPERTRLGMQRFLRSCSSGTRGGLASYRPGERTSPAMTAEALASRLFLGADHGDPAVGEAAAYVLRNPPGDGKPNLYYWYYATLALYQLQDKRWERWNEAMKTQLVERQRADGDEAGSWDPDTVWGGYGGRVYTTALGALCLEVYYRFVPGVCNLAP